MTKKQQNFLRVIYEQPGITTAELHRQVGKDYAHGHHKFTYETVNRMLYRGLVKTCQARQGLRGTGLQSNY